MTQDLPLFQIPNARRSDPSSSHAAITKLEQNGGLQAQRLRVLEWVIRWPGSTSKELSKLSGGDRFMIARRLPDLFKMSLVTRTDAGEGRELRWWPV